MPKVNYDWVKSQFEKANVKKSVGLMVLDFLKLWENVKINEKDAQEAFRVLSIVAMGHALVEDKEHKWVQAMAGFLKVGDEVRVKSDAFTGEVGYLHNGRSGIVVALRSGDVIVNSTDEQEPPLEGAHYKAEYLEKKVPKK